MRRCSLILGLLSLALWLVAPHAGAATTFTVSGSSILKNGSDFVLHGINISGPGSYGNRNAAADVDAIVNVWKFNMVRVNCSIKPRESGKEPHDLDEIIHAFTSRGVVVLIDPRDHIGGYYQDPPVPDNTPSLTDLVHWQRDLAKRYRDNPYVWFEVMSGPGERDEKKVNLEQWLETHERVIKAIRQEAEAPNIIVCEGSYRGCEDGDNGTLPVPEALSAILTCGPDLAKRYANLVFAFNVSVAWSGGGREKLGDYFDRIRARNLPLFVAEYGLSEWGDSTWAIDAALALCRERHIGRCAWRWSPEDRGDLCATEGKGGGWQIDALDGSKPTNLSWIGDRAWDDNHGLASFHGRPLDRTSWTATAFASRKDGDGRIYPPDSAFSAYIPEDDYWASGTPQQPGQWFQIDMGARQTFARVAIDPRVRYTDYPRGYEIYLSNDGVDWGAPIARGTNSQSVLRVSFPAKTARYVKVVQTGKTDHHWTIADFQVYAPFSAEAHAGTPAPGGKEIPLEPRGWSATGEPTSWRSPATPLHPLTSRDDRWSTERRAEPGQYYQVDMGEPQRFHKIILTTGRATDEYPRGFQVFVSKDGVDWGSAIAAGKGAPITTIVFPSHTARYVKVVQTGSSRHNWAIAEFKIIGGADAVSATAAMSGH